MYPQRFPRGPPQNWQERRYGPWSENIPMRAGSLPSMNYQQRLQAPMNQFPPLEFSHSNERINYSIQTMNQMMMHQVQVQGFQQQWQMERCRNQQRIRMEEMVKRREQEQLARIHSESRRTRPRNRQGHSGFKSVKNDAEKGTATDTKVDQNRLDRDITNSESSNQLSSSCEDKPVQSSVQRRNQMDNSLQKEISYSSATKTEAETMPASCVAIGQTGEQTKLDSYKPLTTVVEITVTVRAGDDKRECGLTQAEIELDRNDEVLKSKGSSNGDKDAVLMEISEINEKTELNDKLKYHKKEQEPFDRKSSPEKDHHQSKPDKLNEGQTNTQICADDALLKEDTNETETLFQLERLAITSGVDTPSQSTALRVDLSKLIVSDIDTNDIKENHLQNGETEKPKLNYDDRLDEHRGDQKNDSSNEKVKEQGNVTDCDLRIEGISDIAEVGSRKTERAADQIQDSKKCEILTIENSIAKAMLDTSDADDKVFSGKRHDYTATEETSQNVNNSENISEQPGEEHAANDSEKKALPNSYLEDSAVERIPVTNSAETRTQLCESGARDLPSKHEQASLVDSTDGIPLNDEASLIDNTDQTPIDNERTSRGVNSIETDRTSEVTVGSKQYSAEEDIEEIAGKISEILSDNGSKKHYAVIVEDISDEEKDINKANSTATGTVSPSQVESVGDNLRTSLIDLSVAKVSRLDLSPNVGIKDCQGLNVNNETERPIKSVTEREISVSEKTDLDHETTDEGDVSLHLSGAGLENESQDTDREKSYLECMEVEDISPPLSLDLVPMNETAGNTDTEDTVSNSTKQVSEPNQLKTFETEASGDTNLSVDKTSGTLTRPSDFTMKAGTYHNIFTLLEKNMSQNSITIHEGGSDSSLSSHNVKDKSDTLETGEAKALLPDVVDKESQDLCLVLEDDNDYCDGSLETGESVEGIDRKIGSSEEKNGSLERVAQSATYPNAEQAVNRSESPGNEEVADSDSDMPDNPISGIEIRQERVKVGSEKSSSSMDSLPETRQGSLVEQQAPREQPDEQRKENPPPGKETDFSGSPSDQLGTDSDDDLFDVVPAFLQSVQEVTEQALPCTPDFSTSQSHNSNTDDAEASEVGEKLEKTGEPTLKSRFSLDDLLEDKETSTCEEQRRLEKIHSDCKKDIAEGGFITILDRVEEEGTDELALSEEKQEILNQLNVVESEIREDRPGRLVFNRTSYCCLFSDSLHPTHCGFTVGGGKFIEKHLHSLKLSQYERVVTGSIIQICFEKIQCKEQLLRWLFFLMSIHSDYLIRHGCHRVLMDVLHAQQLAGKRKWSPAVADVLSVFVNYGASLDSLCASSNVSQDGVQIELYSQPSYTAPGLSSDQQGYAINNLLLVLEVLGYSMKENSGKYSSSELTLLLSVLMMVSMDTKLESFCAFDAFHICVHNVVRQYTETDWHCQKISICRLISQISSHHHDRLVLAKLLPLDSRGSYVQRRTSFLMLEDLCCVSERLTDEELGNLMIQHLYQFVGVMKEMVHTDPYKLSSIISLLDLSVGHSTNLTATDREELRSLMDQVKRVSGEVRDNVRRLDRTRVKDMMFRVTNRWSLNIQATRGKQCKMFEFVKPDSRREIETVQTVQSNEESDDSDSEQDSEEDQDEAPCKMPRLEPFYFSPNIRNPAGAGDCTEASEHNSVRSETVRNLSESFRSEKLDRMSPSESGDTEENIAIHDHNNVETPITQAVDDRSAMDDNYGIETTPSLLQPVTKMDCDDDNELPEL